MALNARKSLLAVAGLVAAGFVARKIQQRYFTARPKGQELLANADITPRQQPAGEEHLHVSLGEFLQGNQLKVG